MCGWYALPTSYFQDYLVAPNVKLLAVAIKLFSGFLSLMNIYGCQFFFYLLKQFLKKTLDAERIIWWSLNLCPSTLARVKSQNSFFLTVIFSCIIVRYHLCIHCNSFLYPFCSFFVGMHYKSDLGCIVAHVTLIKCFLILTHLIIFCQCLCQYGFFFK